MLSGYCLSGDQQDSMQLNFKSLSEQHGFIFLPLKAPKTVHACLLCPTSVAAISAANKSAIPAIQMYIQGERITEAATRSGLCTAWDATPACCSENEGKSGGDVPYISSLITLATETLAVSKAYIVGIANGGFMAQRMACERPDLLAGVVAYASGIETEMCSAPGRTPLLLMHGDADLVVPFTGGVNGKGISFPGFEKASAAWAMRNGCASQPATTQVLFKGGREAYIVLEAQYDCKLARTASWRIEKGNHFAAADVSAQMFAAALGWVLNE